MDIPASLITAIKKKHWLYAALILPFYFARFCYQTIKTHGYWFLRYYPGHYGSTIPSSAEIKAKSDALFRKQSPDRMGIDLNDARQIELVKKINSYYADFPFTPHPEPANRYYYRNPMFGFNDGLTLYAFLRHFRPQKIIEIGSGFSSALMLDTSERYMNDSIDFTFIEPYPDRLKSLIRSDDSRKCCIIAAKVQDVSPEVFHVLGHNDFLIIDSSHVVKIGSDLSQIIFSILPQLNPGVLIHLHDVWWPFEYPKSMIMEGRIWNEIYFIRAFLQYNRVFQVLWFGSYMEKEHRELFDEKMTNCFKDNGKSLWLQKTDNLTKISR